MRKISLVWIVLAALWTGPLLAAPVAKPITWKVGKQTFSGFLVYDDASKETRPGLLMVPDWLGVTPQAVDKAKQIAGDDYVVLVVDMFGKGVRPKNPTQAMAQVKKMYADRPAMRARIAGRSAYIFLTWAIAWVGFFGRTPLPNMSTTSTT